MQALLSSLLVSLFVFSTSTAVAETALDDAKSARAALNSQNYPVASAKIQSVINTLAAKSVLPVCATRCNSGYELWVGENKVYSEWANCSAANLANVLSLYAKYVQAGICTAGPNY